VNRFEYCNKQRELVKTFLGFCVCCGGLKPPLAAALPQLIKPSGHAGEDVTTGAGNSELFHPEAACSHAELQSINSIINPWNTRADFHYSVFCRAEKIPRLLVIREEIEFSIDPNIEEDHRGRTVGAAISCPEINALLVHLLNQESAAIFHGV